MTRDVKFYEFIFPFSYYAPLSKLFPASIPVVDKDLPIFSSHQESQNQIMTQEISSISSPSPTDLVSPISSYSVPTGEPLPADGLRRSAREHNAPKYLSDYICNAAFSVISPNPPITPFHSFFFFCTFTLQPTFY